MNTLNLNIPGFSIASKVWGNPKNPPILALHGWLDNANSFDLLAPCLKDEFYFIAVDLPGHGHSSHLPEGCHYHFSDEIFIVIELINALQLDKVHLLGHSMGACLASLVAGVAPDRLLSLYLIEGLGPFSYPGKTACQQLRRFLSQNHDKKSKAYDQFITAATVRATKGAISLDHAKILCERGLIEKHHRFYWRHDQRLLIHSPLSMTETQVLSCLGEISVKSYLLLASKGFSFNKKIIQNRIKKIKDLTLNCVDGGHHIHMEQPEKVSQLVTDFYRTC